MTRLSPENRTRLLAALLDGPQEQGVGDPLQEEAEEALDQGARCIGRYVLLEEVGRGSGGSVWRAFDPILRRTAAIKRLHSPDVDPGVRERLQQEVAALASLSHAGAVQIYDAGMDGDELYFAMEWMEGGSLAKVMELGPLPIERVLQHGHAIAGALRVAHARGLLHLDVKPSNVLLSGDQAHLADFGTVTRLLPTQDRGEAGPIGTPGYMPPEQASGRWSEVDQRADVFGLGATLEALLVGSGPGSDKPPGNLAPELLSILRRAQAPQPDQRFGDVEALMDALEAWRKRRKRAAVAWRGLAGSAIFLALLAFFLRPSRSTEKQLQRGQYEAALTSLGPYSPGAPAQTQRLFFRAWVGKWFDSFSFHPADWDSFERLIQESPMDMALEASSLTGVDEREASNFEWKLLSVARASLEAQPEIVERQLLELVAAYPKRPQPRLLLALHYLTEEQVDQALQTLDGLDHPAAPGIRAACRLAKGEAQAVLEDLERAAVRSPAMGPDRGLALLLLGRNQAAEDVLQQVLQQRPISVAALYNLAVAGSRLGHIELAIRSLERLCALGEDPDVGWDADPATDFSTASRLSFVQLWPSRNLLRRDPWLREIRQTRAFKERISPRLQELR